MFDFENRTGYNKYVLRGADFCDISILEKRDDGYYENLTDACFDRRKSVIYKINSDEPFLLTLMLHETKIYEPYVMPVKIDELYALANFKNEVFRKQITRDLEEKTSDHLSAMMLAGKIFAYNYGKVEITEKTKESIKVSFMRQTFVDGKRDYPVVLKLEGKPVNISVLDERKTYYEKKTYREKDAKDYGKRG